MADQPDRQAIRDPEADLEEAFIAEFLERHGYTQDQLQALPPGERARVLAAASIHAAGKLAEIEARRGFIAAIHHN